MTKSGRDEDTAERELWAATAECRASQKDLRADMADIKAALKEYGDPVKAAATGVSWVFSWKGAAVGLIAYCLPYLMLFALIALLSGNADIIVSLAAMAAKIP